MRWLILLVMFVMVMGATGCSSNGGKELFETAQFEEKQHNLEHARQLYAEIVRKYPGSDLARQAEERLKVLAAGK